MTRENDTNYSFFGHWFIVVKQDGKKLRKKTFVFY